MPGILSNYEKHRPEVGDHWCYYTHRKTHEVRQVRDDGMIFWCGDFVPEWGWYTDNAINRPDDSITCLKCVSVKARAEGR